MTDEQQTKPQPALDVATWWERNTTAPAAQAASLLRRLQIVQCLKRIIPALGAVILLVAFVWPLLLPSLPITEWVNPNGPELAMHDLTYHGTDDKGQPYTVTADKATRNVPLGTDPKKTDITPIINLTTPKANLQTTEGKTVDMSAITGVYNETSQGLELEGQVKLRDDKGMTLDAPQLSVDFTQNRAWTDQPVTANGDFGTINGQGLRLEDGGKKIIFTGQSRAVLNGAPSKDGKPTPAPAAATPVTETQERP